MMRNFPSKTGTCSCGVEIFFANRAVLIDVEEAGVCHTFGHSRGFVVEDFEAANDSGLRVREQREVDIVPVGKVLEDGRAVVANGRQLESVLCKFLLGVLQLDQLRFAKGSPVSGPEKENHSTPRTLERFVGLFLPELVEESERGRGLSHWQSNRSGRWRRRHLCGYKGGKGKAQTEKNRGPEFHYPPSNVRVETWAGVTKIFESSGDSAYFSLDSRPETFCAFVNLTFAPQFCTLCCSGLIPLREEDFAVLCLGEWERGQNVTRTIWVATSLAMGFLGLLAGTAGAQEKQEKSEIGLVIGATVTPSRDVAPGPVPPPGSIIGVSSLSSISFNGSLALGAEYDRRLFGGERVAVSAGADFLASPFDVKISNRETNVIGEYAYIFLTPHVRVKFHSRGTFSPWVLLEGTLRSWKRVEKKKGNSSY